MREGDSIESLLCAVVQFGVKNEGIGPRSGNLADQWGRPIAPFGKSVTNVRKSCKAAYNCGDWYSFPLRTSKRSPRQTMVLPANPATQRPKPTRSRIGSSHRFAST